MPLREHGKDALRPQIFGFAARPFERSRYECDVELALSYRCNMLGLVAIDK